MSSYANLESALGISLKGIRKCMVFVWVFLGRFLVTFLLFVRLLTLNAVNGFENWQDTVQDTGQW